MSRIKKILIANRGEIAVRVARTCRELGIPTVAVFSDADAGAPHTRYSDEAVRIGPAPSRESYLRADALLEAARQTGADAIHPGYGFLSENPEFAEVLSTANIVWIGPPASAIRAMGDKTAARRLMQEANVPVVPGTVDSIDDAADAAKIADEIGYPILIKAAAGGGGKGMRAVHHPDQLQRSLAAARGEAMSSFGDDRVFVEKLVLRPRHIEIQVLADAHGNIVHLFERECSIQRRHQKVIEEAPSPAMTDALRERMGQAAVAAAASCGYVGAGTVEFLVDDELNFYFMEMNTRLQVEHPVTEWITGTDLVAEQISIANGSRLPMDQGDLKIRGHAIECRIYAEDPANDFLPNPGRLYRHRIPAGPGVRVDAGVDEGGLVEIHYDPMISKLSTWAPTRTGAIRRMSRALSEYEIAGVATTIPFCSLVMNSTEFVSGDVSTNFVDNHFRAENLARPDSGEQVAVALIAALAGNEERITLQPDHRPISDSLWSTRREFR